MKKFIFILFLVALISCKSKTTKTSSPSTDNINVLEDNSHFTLVFASCNDQNREQPLWKPILDNDPDVFIWGGDNVYADTADMQKMKADYDKVLANPDYAKLAENTTIIGTWDDHDYGKNDAGLEWEKKDEAQQLLLDFLKFPENDPLRKQQGVYYAKNYQTEEGSVKVILLDTRYFRDSLKKSTVPGLRYEPWKEGEGGSVLGDKQWKWLEEELKDTTANFNVIVTSIQFLADEHGWEKWGNHPSEVKKMYKMLKNAKSKNLLMLSGDRHLAEFSKNTVEGLKYPLIDFTTSGLTHTFPDNPEGINRYRVGKEIRDINFGVLRFDFENEKVLMEIRGAENTLLESLEQQY